MKFAVHPLIIGQNFPGTHQIIWILRLERDRIQFTGSSIIKEHILAGSRGISKTISRLKPNRIPSSQELPEPQYQVFLRVQTPLPQSKVANVSVRSKSTCFSPR